MKILKPTREERKKGLADVGRFAPIWKSSPALLLIKPHLGLIVSVESIEKDDTAFTLAIAVEEAIVAPKGFNTRDTIRLQCWWNQPYLHLDAELISAPYNFYLHFGSKGVRQVRQFRASALFKHPESAEAKIGHLRTCFTARSEFFAEILGWDIH
jgi:hypothetical protein